MDQQQQHEQTAEQKSLMGKILWLCLTNKLVVFLALLFFIGWGILVAPFDWDIPAITRHPVPVDAIPDIGENQQIVFTEWMGRSPQDVEDQISYPLTVSLLGVPGVKTIRSYSAFGFSTVYIIFKENIDFYWSRSRVLEKLNSLPAGTLPEGVQPALGPDATALGQIFWYTLEGRDPQGNPIGGWDLEELRTIQDWYVRYGLLSADGVSEVASVGGFVKEYQIDVDPDAMRAYGVSLADIYKAVKGSNIDVGAKTIELNRVEYFLRGIGFIKHLADIEDSVVKVVDNVPVLVKNVATVSLGPALRRGALDKGGSEAVGGVVVARYGENPLAVIKNVKQKIEEISGGLPSKVHFDYPNVSKQEIEQYASNHGFKAYLDSQINQEAWLNHLRQIPAQQYPAWAAISQVSIEPFYDRTGLIYETLGTLNSALSEEILITVIVVILMVMHLRSSILISGLLPVAVLMCFIAMKVFGVDANIVALSGIAIAIGTMVDMGIVICENILRHLDEAPAGKSRLQVVHAAASEVGSAVLTAVSTTIISFLPVFTMIGPEGKLFKPLAFTKTFALIASVMVALMIIPPAAHGLFCRRKPGASSRVRLVMRSFLIFIGTIIGFKLAWWAGLFVILFGTYYLLADKIPQQYRRFAPIAANILAVIFVGVLLTGHWQPMGPELGFLRNFIFVGGIIAVLLLFFRTFQHFYPWILNWCLDHKLLFLSIPLLLLIMGASIWLGFDKVFAPVPKAAAKIGIDEDKIKSTNFWVNGTSAFPGLGKEFMPALDEGSYLYMPTTMVHASIGEAMDVLSKQDIALKNIPEIDSVVGKIGRAETPLDPAPVSMIETVINYKPEYITDKDGRRVRFRYDEKTGQYPRDEFGKLIPDHHGRPFRQWRDTIKTADDIWKEIVIAAKIQGTTSAPKLQPIAARIVMLQSGMRAPMGVKIKGPSLETIEQVGLDIERLLKEVPGVEPAAVIADRIVGKPYLEIVPDRKELARYGVTMRAFQDVVEIALGGRKVTKTVEGRERFPVRVRYQRELRDQIETIEKVLISAAGGTQIPLIEVAEIRYVRGPQVIKSEDTFLVGYVLFDMKPGNAEVDVVQQCQAYLKDKIDNGQFVLPPGVSYVFAGNYENQLRSQKTLAVVLPVALFVIFLILYFQFKSIITTSLVFSGILVAWSGGFLMLWLYGQPWFLDVELFGVDMQNLFQIHPINLSVAVWVGFLALFGIASDDGVVMGTYLQQSFRDHEHTTVKQIRQATVQAGKRRVRACLMTTATTILALLPILTSSGRGSDVMVPMAIPSFGGMTIEILTMLVVPVLYCMIEEIKLNFKIRNSKPSV
ncbi:MAG: efflux RND transporter permease subunit [Planctomycetota bacterium]|jgi:Cu(I)/Ag(I) efflux system membrane protein CusA/SilA